MSRISLCMIVRDEEQAIGRCLRSVQELVDEMVVVDTGSTDGTAKICESFGAKVFPFVWQDDFSAARNYSLSLSTCEWILVLDADDELPPGECSRIRELVELSAADAFFFITKNLVGDADNPSVLNYAQLRLFANLPEFRYQGIVHEFIPKRENTAYRVEQITVIHHGYLDAAVVRHSKIQRNLSLLTRELNRRPTDAAVHYYIGNEMLRWSKPHKAVLYYERAQSLLHESETRLPDLPHKYASALSQVGRVEQAKQVIQEALDAQPLYTDLWYLRGCIELGQHHLKEARDCFIKCIELGAPPTQFPSEQGCGTYLSEFSLGTIALLNQQVDDARFHFARCLNIKANYAPALVQICLCDWVTADYVRVSRRLMGPQFADVNAPLRDLLGLINESLETGDIRIRQDLDGHTNSLLACLATLSSFGQFKRTGRLFGQLPTDIQRRAMTEAWPYELLVNFHLEMYRDLGRETL